MKIAILGIRGLPANYSGFETCAEHTSRFWTKFGHYVLVYCRKNRYPVEPKYHGSVRLKYTRQIPSKSFETLSHTLISIFNLCFFERNYKLVHLYNSGNAIFIPILKFFGKKVVISVDGIEWRRDKWGRVAKMVYKIGEWFAIKFADTIISDNKEIEAYYLNKYQKETTLIAYGAKEVESDNALSQRYLDANELKKKEYFIFVGRLVPEKGVHNLINSYKQVKTSMPLVIIGDDHTDSDYKKSLFEQENESIRFLGFKYGEEYEQILANALLYVSSSHLEGTSPSLLAAMGAKVCCLINGIPENKSTVQGAAFLFKENNFEDLVEKWGYLVSNIDEINKMSERGYDKTKESYSWEKIASDYINSFSLLN